MSAPDQDNEQIEQPFLTHLIELRDRLLRVVVAVLILFLGGFYFANDIYHIVATPLMDHLPTGASMISTKPAGTFFTPMKLTLMLAIFAVMPYILYQVWGFIAPGLYTHERKLIMPLMISSTFLFYAGMAFAYYVVFPIMFRFFISVAPEGVEVMTDISEYLDFILKIFFAFGIAFEVPIVTILMVWTGMTTPESLAEKRPYIIVGAFVIGMMLTPPDIISQTLLAVPMWALFEVGLIASHYFLRIKREKEEAEDREYAEENLDSEEAMEAALDRYERDEAALDEEAEAMDGGAGNESRDNDSDDSDKPQK